MTGDRITKIARIIERVQQTRLNENGAAWIGEWAPAAAHEIIALFTIPEEVRERLVGLAERLEKHRLPDRVGTDAADLRNILAATNTGEE